MSNVVRFCGRGTTEGFFDTLEGIEPLLSDHLRDQGVELLANLLAEVLGNLIIADIAPARDFKQLEALYLAVDLVAEQIANYEST